MCLAVPGKVVSLHPVSGTQMGKVDFDGITKDICLAYIPDVTVGEYVIVHVGFAIERPKSVTTNQVRSWLDGKDHIWGE